MCLNFFKFFLPRKINLSQPTGQGQIKKKKEPAMASPRTNSGIVTDENSGERQIPESIRADGSTRKAIKIRPGYRPPEDVEVYKNRTAAAFRERGKRIGIPGAAGAQDSGPEQQQQATSSGNKNAKRREARRKAKATGGGEAEGDASKDGEAAEAAAGDAKPEAVDPEVEKEKKARNLKKKLKQARDLQNKKEGGEALLPEQIAKMMKINELVRELEALGFEEAGEGQQKTEKGPDGETAKGEGSKS